MNTPPTDAKAIFLAAIAQTSPDERADRGLGPGWEGGRF
jgi:hypothetical protein